MPNLNPRRFSHPETLKKVSRESLITWLAPARDYFAARGIVIPQAGSSDGIDYEKLAGAFMDPEPEMPQYLAESLYMINEMADQGGMDAILEEAEARSVALAVPEDCTPADVALAGWLQARDLLEELHVEHQLARQRSFVYFGCEGEEVPAFEPPDAARISALEGRLNDWYGKKKRGRVCKVLMYPKENECRFLVRHGEPCKREGAIKDGETTTVFYRPEKYDVLVYDSERGEIRIHCSGKKELEELRKAFGLHLFGNEGFFPGTGKYTLEPLLLGRECVACTDLEGIESVTLTTVELFYRTNPWQRVTRESEDIFALVENGLFRWPAAPERIARAGFEVKFTNGNRPRRVTLIPPNRALYGRDDDSILVEQWLRARGFIVEVGNAVQDHALVSA